MSGQSSAFRAKLLSDTLGYVVERVPYYRKLAQQGLLNEGSKLDDFPLIDSGTVAADFRQFVVLDEFPDYLVTSGGTTGLTNVTFRNEDEFNSAHYYYTG